MVVVTPLFQGQPALSPFQDDVLAECMEKKSGGMSLSMGLGKTLITTVLAQLLIEAHPDEGLTLVVCSKSLIGTWVAELDKFYQGRLPYQIFHGVTDAHQWTPAPATRFVITTPEVLAKAYREHQVANMFVWHEHMAGAIRFKRYRFVERPWLRNYTQGNGLFYSLKWGCLVVDEAQEHTNIETAKCQAIGALCAHHRWMLSGTMFNEPKVARILGFYIMMNMPTPRDLPATHHMIRHSRTFVGFNPMLVIRRRDPTVVMPEKCETVIRHDLTKNEATVYQSIRHVLNEVKRQADRLRAAGDTDGARKYSSYKLALITYLRQSLMCAIVPITSVCVDLADFKGRNQLSRVLMRELQKHDLDQWLNTEESIRSSRIEAILTQLQKYKDTRVVLFGCFISCLRILLRYVDPTEFNIFIMHAGLSAVQRAELQQQFEAAPTGILFMTYQLGAEGLNLQCASTVFLTDFWWHDGKTEQAIARVFRTFQKAARVNVVMFTSNTGIEKALFEKQYAKLQIIDDLATGCTQRKVPTMNMDEVLRIINQEENYGLRQNITNFRADVAAKADEAVMPKRKSPVPAERPVKRQRLNATPLCNSLITLLT
jgi:SNF2 family DNA or RNA helicase